MHKWHKSLKETIQNAKKDRIARSQLIFQISMFSNCIFVLIYLIDAIGNQSVWSLVVGGYYASIAWIRIHLVRDTYWVNHESDYDKRVAMKRRCMRTTGSLMLVLDVMFVIMEMYMVKMNASFHYGKMAFITTILYVLAGFWASLYNVIKDRGVQSMLSALRLVNLSASVTGLFILFASLIDTYWKELGRRESLLPFAGSIVFIVLTMAAIHVILIAEKKPHDWEKHHPDHKVYKK